MKLTQYVLASEVSGGYFQKWKNLPATEKTERQVMCDAKAEETKALFPIANGAWNCPNLGLRRPRVICNPTCLPGYKPNWTDGSISKPKKDHPRFMTRCGNPANIAKRNLPSGIQLACTPIPEHPCMATAAEVTIPNGSLSLNTELTPSRATFDVVCDWGETMGKLYCNRDSFPFWKNPYIQDLTNACAGRCGIEPCDGLDNCSVVVDACEVSPVKNRLWHIGNASRNYRISADVYCAPVTAWSDYRNVLHVVGGSEFETPGGRTFAIYRHPMRNQINTHMYNPNGANRQSDVYAFDCTEGQWHTFSVEVLQDSGSPSILNYDFQVDGNSIGTGSYLASGGKSTGTLQFFVSDNRHDAATGYNVKNFIYQPLPEIDCGDPCAGLDECNVIVDGCEVAPVKNNQVAILPASLNYKISADIYCAPVTAWDTWHNVLHVTDGNDNYTPGSRTFAIWRHPLTKQLNIHTNNPNGSHGDHSDATPFLDCTIGQWHSFSVEVRQDTGVPSTLNYDLQVDGNSIRTGSYPASGGKSTGDLQFFVSNDWWPSATGYNVKNFVYQTFAEI